MANELEPAVTPEQQKSLVVASRAMTDADLMVIDCVEMYAVADAMLTEVHNFIKRVEKEFEDPIDKANAALKAIRGLANKITTPAENAKATLRRKMGDYKTAEHLRVAQASREAERARQAEIAAAEAKLSDTEQLVAEGSADVTDLERAEADVAIAHVSTAAAVVETAEGKATDAADWAVEITDLPTALETIAADLRKDAPRFTNTIDWKISQLKDWAKSTKGRHLPGFKFTPKTRISARS